MNTESGLQHLSESMSLLRNSKTKPISDGVSSEIETKLAKLGYSLLPSGPRHYGRNRSDEPRYGRRLTACDPRMGSVTQPVVASFESAVWIVSCLFVILGLIHAAGSEQPLLWLAVWPAPVALACTIFTFFRQGFHFEDGALVLGRQRD
jgi:hypothetical protein